MSKMIAIHTGCGGPILEDDNFYPEQVIPFLTDEEFTVTCYTCLDDIFDRSEIKLTEFNSQ